MDGPNLAALVETGELLYATKLFILSMSFLWLYDYSLTLGDEIKHAWSMKKSWIFALFIANRYTPVLHILSSTYMIFHYTKPFCEATKWAAVFQWSVVTVLAHITITLRIYAVTLRNKLFGGVLCALIVGQLVFGTYAVIKVAMGPVQQLPDVGLDLFRVCLQQRWRFGELFYINLVIVFDILAFLMVLHRVKRSRTNRYPGVPNILDAILRDATVHFIVIFVSQLVFQLFVFVAPLDIQLLPGVACTVLTPIMASRLMLSLKKDAAESTEPRTLTIVNRGKPLEDGSLRFAPDMLSESHEATHTLPGEEAIELESTLRVYRSRGSWQVL